LFGCRGDKVHFAQSVKMSFEGGEAWGIDTIIVGEKNSHGVFRGSGSKMGV
jgi:hypothetical protein